LKRWFAGLLCAGLASHAFARPLDVSFASLDRDGAGSAIALKGVLLLPHKPAPPGGFPAIIALLGCGCMYSLR
jgi:hypothetical protein